MPTIRCIRKHSEGGRVHVGVVHSVPCSICHRYLQQPNRLAIEHTTCIFEKTLYLKTGLPTFIRRRMMHRMFMVLTLNITTHLFIHQPVSGAYWHGGILAIISFIGPSMMRTVESNIAWYRNMDLIN